MLERSTTRTLAEPLLADSELSRPGHTVDPDPSSLETAMTTVSHGTLELGLTTTSIGLAFPLMSSTPVGNTEEGVKGLGEWRQLPLRRPVPLAVPENGNGEVTVSRPVGGVLCLPLGSGGHPSTRPTWGLLRCGAGGQPKSHAWPCSGWGLPSRPSHPGRWCALTAPFHPYLCGTSPSSAVCSLWHFPAGHPDWPLASTLPCGAPTFLDSNRLARAAATRPAHRLLQSASLTGRGRGRGKPPGRSHR